MSKPKFKNQSKIELQDKKNLKKSMKAKDKGPPPKKKSVKLADKDVRSKIANGELVKVCIVWYLFLLDCV